MKKPSKLVLGTAQLGLDYGIANKFGKPTTCKALELLETALNNGVTVFDTAPTYGNSERLIGDFIKNEPERAKEVSIISKMPKYNPRFDILRFIDKTVNMSLSNLGIEMIDYYLLHDPKDLEDYRVVDGLFSLKRKGLILEPGASVYSVEDAEIAIENGLKVLQIPANIFDQRFLNKRLLSKFKQNEVTLLVRSVFLQGLFFFESAFLPTALVDARPYLEKLYSICKQYSLSTQELALKFIKDFPEIDHVLIGAESRTQLMDNLKIFEGPGLSESVHKTLEEAFKNVHKSIIDPRMWEK